MMHLLIFVIHFRTIAENTFVFSCAASSKNDSVASIVVITNNPFWLFSVFLFFMGGGGGGRVHMTEITKPYFGFFKRQNKQTKGHSIIKVSLSTLGGVECTVRFALNNHLPKFFTGSVS